MQKEHVMAIKMNRFIINKIRFVLENLIPPVVRDSFFFYGLMKSVYGTKTHYLLAFKENITSLKSEEYANYYKDFPPVMQETDLNQKCIDKIVDSLEGDKIIDVGCGRGYLLNQIALHCNKKGVGVDFIIPQEVRERYPHLTLIEANIEKLPFADKEFDTVICAHTLEHILDFDGAIKELRRICKKKLILVVPSEREYKYAFNFHLHFFPYKRSFINRIMPKDMSKVECDVLDGDIFYIEKI